MNKMKKTYIQPSMAEVKVNQPVLLSGSLQGISDNTPKEWGAREDDGDFDW